MRILHLETGQHFYGGAQQVALLLHGLHAHGITNFLVCDEASPLAHHTSSVVQRSYALPLHGDLDPYFPARFARILHTVQPDLVHLHSRRGADTVGAIVARWRGQKIVLSRRVDNPETAWLVGLKYRLYDHVIAISKAIQNILIQQGVPAQKITCVPSAVEIERYARLPDPNYFQHRLGIAPTVPIIGMVAQFIERKGHKTLISALPTVLKAYPDAQVVLFGQGPLQSDIQRLAGDVGIARHVTFAGFIDDLERLLPSITVLVHPALQEGLGVSLLQAAAAGIPIIATPVGGIPEIVQPGLNGLLVAPGDPTALATALMTLLADPYRARAMGEAGRPWVRERFSVAAMVQGNQQVYQQVLRCARS